MAGNLFHARSKIRHEGKKDTKDTKQGEIETI